MNKIKDYTPRTKIPDMIKEILEKSNYRQGYEWQYDNVFISNNSKIEVVEYDLDTEDWCIIKVNGKEMKVNKKYLRKLWELRD